MDITEERVDRCASDFPVGFSTVTSGSRIYVAYYNSDHDITVACRERPGAPWTKKILPSRANWDSHRSIVLAMDRARHLHVSGNMHADPLVYFKTSGPFDVSTLERVAPMVNADEEARATYPRFLEDAGGDLVFLYRLGGSGNGITIANRYRSETGAFERVSDRPLFDGLNEMSAYSVGPFRGPDGRFHMTWVWRDTPHCETNHDLSYAVSDDLVHWSPHGGAAIDLPITPRTDQFVVDPVPPGGGMINGGHATAFDPSGRPVIAYFKYDAEGVSQMYVARCDTDGWCARVVSEWDYRWAFNGSGSITFEIRVERPRFEAGRLVVPYWHVQRGHGELHVDADTSAPIEDRVIDAASASPYPAHLVKPNAEGLTVQWLRADPGSDRIGAFRWEVGGKRRRYDPPDPPIPPCDLVYYEFGA